MKKTEREIKADWSPIKTYINQRTKPANGGDYIGIGCGNIALTIICGLTYIGDCIRTRNDDQSKEKS